MNNNLSTGNAISVQQKTETPQQKRAELANRIKIYIAACRIIMTRSSSAYYKAESRWVAMDFAINLERLCGAPSALKELCSYTIQVRKYLQAILPIDSNDSHDTLQANLEEILNDCREHLATKTYVS